MRAVPFFDPGYVVLSGCELFYDTSYYNGIGAISNLGIGGSGLDGTPSNTIYLPYNGLQYMYFPGGSLNYITSPADVAYNPTTSLDVRAALRLDDWTPSALSGVVGRMNSTTSQSSWGFQIVSSGRLQLTLSSGGSSSVTIPSSGSAGLVDGQMYVIRGVWVPGMCTFFYKATTPATYVADMASNTGWTQVGSNVTSSVPASLFASNSPIYVAKNANTGVNGITGDFHGAQVIVDGSTVLTVLAPDAPAIGSWSSPEGRTLTVVRGLTGNKAVIVSRNLLLFSGSNSVITAPDSPLMNFNTGEDFTIGVAAKLWATSSSQGGFVSKRSGTDHMANKGYGIKTVGTSRQTYLTVQDGTTQGTAATAVEGTEGVLTIYSGRRNGSSLIPGVGTTFSPSTQSTGDLTNTNPVSIGRNTNTANYQAMELYGAFVKRGTLTDTEIADIVTYFGS